MACRQRKTMTRCDQNGLVWKALRFLLYGFRSPPGLVLSLYDYPAQKSEFTPALRETDYGIGNRLPKCFGKQEFTRWNGKLFCTYIRPFKVHTSAIMKWSFIGQESFVLYGKSASKCIFKKNGGALETYGKVSGFLITTHQSQALGKI